MQWKQWIQENLARGCTVDSMVDVMAAQNFERASANRFIRDIAAGGVSSLPVTVQAAPAPASRQGAAYQYEKPLFHQPGNVIKTPDRDVRVTFRMKQPVVAVFDNLLSPDECAELIRLSSIKLKRSTIVDPKTGREEVIDDRSSFGTFFTHDESDFVASLERRISVVMNQPIENGEGLQILNYKVGGEYKAHFDYFTPSDSGSAVHLANGGQRVSTLIMYLNDVEQAGETIFPEIGLTVTPKTGSAVYFEYCNSQNQLDPLTLHGGAPVQAGEKWIATKWMRQRRYGG